MKKFLILTVLTITFGTVFSQKSKVVSAYTYLRHGDIGKAKEAIDLASVHEQTINSAKTWLYRGQVYLALANSGDKFTDIKDGAIIEAYKAFMKTYEMETKKIDTRELKQGLVDCIRPLSDAGVALFNEKKYDKAITYFENCVAIGHKFNSVDTLSYFNAALAADRANMFDKAIQVYNKLIEFNHGGADMFTALMNVYKRQGNDDEAIKSLQRGREKYPDDQLLLTAEINYYITNEKFDEALTNLDAAIKNDISNATLYFARGAIYDGKMQSANGDAEKIEEFFQGASNDYKKAIELKSDYFDANYNLGALYFNKGAETFNKANDLPLKEVEKAEEMRKGAETHFASALPFLEKAHALDSTDKGTMISLKNIYARTNNTEKYNSINEKLMN